MSKLLNGKAIISYDPYRPGMKKRTMWWSVATIHWDLSRYYRWWIKSRYGLELHQPSWDCHISVIRGEKPKPDLLHLWKKYDKKEISFNYSNHIRVINDGKFFVLEVESKDLQAMRIELQLPISYKFHITIGRLYTKLDKYTLDRINNEQFKY